MQLIPVIDLKGGDVVRGVAGQRASYRPVESALDCEATPASVAQAFAERFDFRTVYVADLDAIAGAKPDLAAYQAIAAHLPNLIIDAGVSDVGRLCDLFPTGVVSEESEDRPRLRFGLKDTTDNIVVGLESLSAIGELNTLGKAIGEERAVFSLDLKRGKPLTSVPQWKDANPLEIVGKIVQSGFRRIIVLDLAQVGVGQGPSVCGLCREIRQTYPRIQITSGGGVRGASDLYDLEKSGCDAALVASAFHNGSLTPSQAAVFKSLSV